MKPLRVLPGIAPFLLCIALAGCNSEKPQEAAKPTVLPDAPPPAAPAPAPATSAAANAPAPPPEAAPGALKLAPPSLLGGEQGKPAGPQHEDGRLQLRSPFLEDKSSGEQNK